MEQPTTLGPLALDDFSVADRIKRATRIIRNHRTLYDTMDPQLAAAVALLQECVR